MATLMTPRKFDRYMVAIGMGTHPKLARLTDGEFRAHVVGILAVAAMAPVRGRLLVGALPAEAIDIARTAGVPEKVAAAAMRKLMAVGVLLPDGEHNCLRVHDWEDVNPPPKVDATAADRQRRYRASSNRKPIPGAIKDEVMARDNGRCVRCGSEDYPEYHHRVPVAKGGTNDADNLEIRCFDCHRNHTHDHDGVTQVSRRDSRNGDANVTPHVTPPEVEVEVEVEELPASQAQQAARKRVARQVDQTQAPVDFPTDLLSIVDAVLAVLHRVWEQRGGIEPMVRGVALGILRNPRADHVRVSLKLEQWLTAGNGRRAQCRDVCARFGDWVENEGAALKVIDGGGNPKDERQARRLAAMDRLTNGGTP